MRRRFVAAGLLGALLWVGSVLSTDQVANAGIEWCCSPPPMEAGIASHPVTPNGQPTDFRSADRAYAASAKGMGQATKR